MAYGEGASLVDLECGISTNAAATSTAITFEVAGNAESGDSAPSCRIGRTTLSRCNAEIGGGSNTNSGDDISNISHAMGERIELLIDKCSACEEDTRDAVPPFEKKNPREQRKKQNLNNSSKPPRPPKGPLLSASDLKLVKELSEMASRKRARIERMKALRKMKETKRNTSNSNLSALVITVMFFVVIIFQGVLSGSNAKNELVGSPAPATTNEGFISMQVVSNGPTNNEMNKPSSPSYNYMEQPSSISPQEAEGREVG
ncbi:hypothetical protein vseg_014063 [Gypsophila vaccaria]